MKKLLASLILVLVLSTQSFASLTFGAISTDRVVIAPAASINDLATTTALYWINPTTLNANYFVVRKGPQNEYGRIRGASHDQIQSVRSRVGGDAIYQTNSFLTVNTWWCVAVTFDQNVTPSMHIYSGTVLTSLVEQTYSSTQDTGTTLVAEADSLTFGNRTDGAGTVFLGGIALVSIWNRVLTLGELQSEQFRLRVTSGCVGFWVLGFNGTNTQPDWSGNGNSGTVTGATVSDHVPLGPTFGFLRDYDWGEPSTLDLFIATGLNLGSRSTPPPS